MTNNKQLLLLPLALIFLVAIASIVPTVNSSEGSNSVAVFLIYDETTSMHYEIYDGESVGFTVSAHSILETNMIIAVDLLDSSGHLIGGDDLISAYTIDDNYSQHYTLTEAIYQNPGDYILRATVVGASGAEDMEELTLKILEQPADNNKPVITSTPITEINENQLYNYRVTATDADGDALTYSLTQKPSWLTISSTGLISGKAPSVDFSKEYAVTVQVSDGKDFTTQFFTILVKDTDVVIINHLPVITSTPIKTVNENSLYLYQVNANDEDDDLLNYRLVASPSWLAIGFRTGLVSGTAPNVNADTTFNVNVEVSDEKSITRQTYALTVKNVPEANHLPVITSTPVKTVNENSLYLYQVTATDADGNALVYSLTERPSWLTINSEGLISGTTPEQEADTNYNVVVQVSDGIGSVRQSYALLVKNLLIPPPVNHAPVAQNLNYVTNEDTSVTITLSATDSDGNSLGYLIITSPAHGDIPGKPNSISDIKVGGILSFTKKTFTYTPDPDFNGVDSFTYIATDGKSYSNIATVTINVKPVDEPDTTPPVITIISPESKTYSVDDVLFKITTNEKATAWFSLDGGSNVNMNEVSANTFTFNMRDLDDGSHTVTFYAKDLAGNIGTKSVTFRIDTDDDEEEEDDDDNDGDGDGSGPLIFGMEGTKKPRPTIDLTEEAQPKEKKAFPWFLLFTIFLILSIILLILIISIRMRNNVNGG
jgi:hypothetical protein